MTRLNWPHRRQEIVISQLAPSRHGDGSIAIGQTVAAAGLAILLFALTPVTTRIAAAQIDGFTLGVFRTVGAGIVATPILLLLRLRPPNRAPLWGLLLISALGGFVGFPLLFSMGTQRTSACHAALIMATAPLLTGLIGMATERRLPRMQWLLGAAIAFAGETVLIVSTQRGAVPTIGTATSALGDALVLAGCVSAATSFVAGARLTEHIGSWAATFWALVLASIALAPLAFIEASQTEWTSLTASSWVALLHLAVGAGVVGWASWYWALARGGIARVSVLQFFQPVVSLVFATLLLGEALSAAILLAASAILVGIAIARRS